MTMVTPQSIRAIKSRTLYLRGGGGGVGTTRLVHAPSILKTSHVLHMIRFSMQPIKISFEADFPVPNK